MSLTLRPVQGDPFAAPTADIPAPPAPAPRAPRLRPVAGDPFAGTVDIPPPPALAPRDPSHDRPLPGFRYMTPRDEAELRVDMGIPAGPRPAAPPPPMVDAELAPLPESAPRPEGTPAPRGLGAEILRLNRDLGASIVSGVGQIVEFPGQVQGLVTGDWDNASTRAGKAIREYAQTGMSPELLEKQRQAQEIIKAAEQEGFGAEVQAVLSTYLSDPALLATFTVEQLPSLLGTLGGGKLAQWGTQLLARGRASAPALSRAGQVGSIGTGAAMQGASVGDEARDAVLNLPPETLAAAPAYQALIAGGVDPEAAKQQLAQQAARLAGSIGGAISVGTAALLPGVERMAFGHTTAGQGIIRRVLTGGLAEGAQEGLEEGGGRAAQNFAVQQIDPNQSIMQGVGAQGTMGAIPGAVMGGGVAALTGGEAPAAAPPPAPQPAPPTGGPRQEPYFGTQPPAPPTAPVPPMPGPTREDLRANLADPRPLSEILAERRAADEARRTELVDRYGLPPIGQGFDFELPGQDPLSGQIEDVTEQGGQAIVRVRGADGQVYSLRPNEFRVLEGDGTREAPVRVETPQDVDRAAQRAEQPTPAQAEAGNYRQGHLEWQGFDIAIETPAGGTRSGVDPDGKPWSVRMPNHYGRLKGTKGADGDQLDIYLGPNPDWQSVVVIDQIDPRTGKFDEHKIMAGFDMEELAEEAYLAAFSDGSGLSRIGATRSLTLDELRTWIASGNTRKPLAYAGTPKYREVVREDRSPKPNDNYRGGIAAPPFQAPASPPRAPVPPGAAPAAEGPAPVVAPAPASNAPRDLDMDRRAFKGALEKTGAAQYGGADYVIAEASNGGFYFRRTKDGNRVEKGAGYPAKWSREEAIRRATLEAFSGAQSAPQAAPAPTSTPETIAKPAAPAAEQTEPLRDEPEPRVPDGFTIVAIGDTPKADFDLLGLPVSAVVRRESPLSTERGYGATPYQAVQDALRRIKASTARANSANSAENQQKTEQNQEPDRARQDAQPQPPKPATQPAEKSAETPNWGASNKLVSKADYDDIRAKLKAKLRGQLNSGIDPEILALGARAAVFHIEAGARKFADFARRIAADFETTIESLKPYLRSWYNGARDMMEDRGLDVADMDPADKVKAELERLIAGEANGTTEEPEATEGAAEPKLEPEQKPAPEPVADEAEEAPAATQKPFEGDSDNARLVRAFMNALIEGRKFPSIAQAREIAKPIVGRIEPGTPLAKTVDEAFEVAIVQAARAIVADGRENKQPPTEIYDKLVDLYKRQPPLNVRTSTSVANQAYSTPVPLAFLASELAGIGPDTMVYEPTAGNGALLIGVENPRNAFANELNDERAAALREQGFRVTSVDAAEPAQGRALRANDDVDAVIANPPFGVVRGDDQQSKVWKIDDRYQTTEIDHAISLRSLAAIPDNGKAVLIIGGIAKTATSQEARSEAYRGKAKVQFYLTLYRQYNVVDHFTVAGELYERQGAGWPVDVIVIDGRRKSERKIPSVDVPVVFRSWEDLKEKFGAAPRTALEAPGQVREPDGGNVVGGTQGSDERPGAAPGRSGDRGDGGRAPGQNELLAGGRPDATGDARLPELPAAAAEPGSDQERGRADRSPDAAAQPRVAAPRADKPAEVETNLQVAYAPASAGEPLGTLAPVNMRDAITSALDTLKARVGDIDAFVADRLGYKDNILDKYFAAEQVDAIALGLDNFDRGRGFIIGDQTGIGKGRVVAAMIRYAIRQGAVPVFVTEKPGLYADMFRDMNDIGIKEMLGRDVRALMTNAAERVPLDDEGKAFLESPSAGKHNADLARFGAEPDVGGHDVVFTTYSQMQTVKGKITPRMAFLEAIAPRSIVIFDESHNAGGQGPDTQKKPGAPPNRAEFARILVGKAKAVFYSSATYAKRPDVMDLYSKTDMPIAVDGDVKKLSAAIEKGGVPLQQAVATMLARAGQYVRRERSFDGVSYDVQPVNVDIDTYKQFSKLLGDINAYYENFIEPAKGALDEEVKAEGESVGHDNATGTAGVESTSFSSGLHNIISQMLLALKADQAAEQAIAAARRDEKPVITLANTMGAFLKDYAEETNTSPGHALKISMADVMLKQIDRQRHYTIKKPWSNEPAKRGILTDAQIGPRGLAAEKALKDFIKQSRLDRLPASPIDWIHKRLNDAGLKSGEITGRKEALTYEADGTVRYRIRPSKDTKTAGKRAMIAEFNDGRMDVMILNQSGSTGISLHASERFKDQRKRTMIIAQAEANIDTHMQMLGRVHRTGQVVKPAYIQLIANVPAEKRPAAVLQKKMASLNANTTASRSSALTAKDVPDFMNQYGDKVAVSVMAENHDLHRALGEPLKFGDDDKVEGEGAMRKVTGRIPMLPLEQQETLYSILEAEYEALIAQLDAMGENALEAKTMALDAKLEKKIEAVKSKGGTSPFAQGVDAEVVDVKRLGRPFKSSQVIEQIADALGVDRPTDEDPIVALRRLTGPAEAAMEKTRVEALERFSDYQREVLDDMREGPAKEQAGVRFNDQQARFTRLMDLLYVGATVRLENDKGNFYAVVTKITPPDGTKVKNPLALGSWKVQFAMADAARQMVVPMSQLEHADQKTTRENTVMVRPMSAIGDLPIIRAFDQMQGDRREKRAIFTGNMLAAVDLVKGRGQIVNYQTEDGQTKTGILMSRDFDVSKFLSEQAVPLGTGGQVMRFIERSGETAFSSDDAIEVAPLPNGNARISVARAKALGGKYFLDREVLRAAGRDFVLAGQKMRVDLNPVQAEQVVDAMRNVGAKFEARSGHSVAKAIRGDKSSSGERFQLLRADGETSPRRRRPTSSAPMTNRALDERREKVFEALREALDEIGLSDVSLAFPDRLLAGRFADGREAEAAGRFRTWGWTRPLIEIALTGGGRLRTGDEQTSTLYHEAIHALKAMGLFSPAEWKVLSERSEKVWMKEHGLDDRALYKDMPKQLRIEEGVAFAFQDWMEGRGEPPAGGLIARAFRKFKRFFEALRNALMGRGFRTVEGIFEDVESGQVGRRGRIAERADRDGPRKNFDPMYADAWHGSPHRFDRFTTAKIGTGEGAQAYGWGLYFAGRKEVAQHYRKKLAGKAALPPEIADIEVTELPDNLAAAVRHVIKNSWELKGLFADDFALAEYFDESTLDSTFGSLFKELSREMGVNELVRALRDAGATQIKETPGRLYKVTLAPAEDEYLLWDKPLSEQSEKVRAALAKLPKYDSYYTGGRLYESLASEFRRQGGAEFVSRRMAELGIAGIKYLDGQSRKQGEGDYNYVVFDEADVQIDAMYSLLDSDKVPLGQTEKLAEDANAELVAGADMPFVKDAGLLKRKLVHPRTIAAFDKHFVPVYRAAVRQFETRDQIAAQIGREAQPYMDLPPEDRAQVDRVLELGRLEGTVYGADQLREGVTNDPEQNEGRTEPAVLSKPGQTIKLTDRQIEGYRAVRSAMNLALDLFKQRIVEEWGYDPATVKDSADLVEMARNADGKEADRHNAAAQILREIEQAQRTGYVPFTRWGQVAIAVRKEDETQMSLGLEGGPQRTYRTVHYEQVEVDSPVNRLARLTRRLRKRETAEQLGQIPEVKERLAALRAQYGDDPAIQIRVFQVGEGGPIEQQVRLSDVDMLAEVGRVDDTTWEKVREQLETAQKMRSFRKHFFGAKNTPGYSVDFERAIADYTIGIAGYLARRQYGPIWDSAIGKIPTTKPKLREYAQNYRTYTQSPQEELQALRQAGFIWYLAGSPATAMVNATQVPLVTMPYLTQFANPALVNLEIAKAQKDAALMLTASQGFDLFDPAKAPADVREAFQLAWDEGFFVPLNTWELMGTSTSRSKVLRKLAKKYRMTVDAVALMFTTAERLNRIVTWLAAYRLAQRQNVVKRVKETLADNALARSDELFRGFTPEKFAGFVVDETQLRMGKVNRPEIMRGAGTAILQFKGFVMQMLELQFRMAFQHKGPRSKAALALWLLLLILSAGVWGFPFAEDAKDIVEALHKKLRGIDLDLETEFRELIAELMGPKLAEALSTGFPRLAGVDLQRIGMGNVLPGTGEEAGGIPLDITVGRLSRAIEDGKRGDWFQAIGELLPNFLKNPADSASWATEGVKSQASGRVIIPPEQVGMSDVALKALGFTPAQIANRRELERAKTRANTATREVKDQYLGRLAQILADVNRAESAQKGDEVARLMRRYQQTLDDIAEFNDGRPVHEQVRILPQTLRDRVRQELLGAAAKDKKAPKQARGRREELETIYGVER